MVPNPDQHPIAYLEPGQAFVTDRPYLVTTVLGSCISVTLFDRAQRIAGITHALLPAGLETGTNDDLRYADLSLRRLLREVESRGARRRHLEVKLFGGGDVIGSVDCEKAVLTVGRQNVAAAVRTIEREGLRLSASDVGGSFGRKMIFDTASGEVLLRRLPPLSLRPTTRIAPD